MRADDKHLTRLNLIKDLLSRLHYGSKDAAVLNTNPEIIFQYDETYLQKKLIAP